MGLLYVRIKFTVILLIFLANCLNVMAQEGILSLDPPINLSGEFIEPKDIFLDWDSPNGGDTTEWLFYDNAVYSGGYTYGNHVMSTHMSPSAPCKVLMLKYHTNYVYNEKYFLPTLFKWEGSQPGSSIIYKDTVEALDNAWTVVDVSEQNITFTGDFVVGFGALSSGVFLEFDANLNNGRSWDYDTTDGSWSAWHQAYLIRALVEYDNGSTEELGDPPTIKPLNKNIDLLAHPTDYSQVVQVKPINNLAATTKALLGYNIYRDDVLIAYSLETKYLDEKLEPETYTYYVTVEYDDGESDASNYVAVDVYEVDQYNLTLYLEGPFLIDQMIPYLYGSDYIPFEQPYNIDPWYYGGSESIPEIPNLNIIDWVLLELRKTNSDVSTAIPDSTIDMNAGFLLNDGSIVNLDGASPMYFRSTPSGNLHVVVWHRNHLGVISNYPLTGLNGIYNYNYSTEENQVYGGSYGHKELVNGFWGLIASDGNGDGIISNPDKYDVWIPQAGSSGYHGGDFNLDGEVTNTDKNKIWIPNSGKVSQVPDGPCINW